MKYIATRNGTTIRGNYLEISKAIGVCKTTLYKAVNECNEVNGWKVEEELYERVFTYVLTHGNERYEGTADEMALKFETTPATLRTYYTRGRKLHNLWSITRYKKQIHKKINKEKTEFDNLLSLLRTYGNTVTLKNPTKYKDQFKKEGLDVKITKSTIDETHYLLEVQQCQKVLLKQTM